VIQRSLNAANAPFGAQLATLRSIDSLRLGKTYTALMVEAEKLHRQVDQYAYGPPPVRFTDADVDQARAAGVLIEFAGASDTPIVCDKAVYREIAKQAVKRTVDELRARAAAKAQSKRSSTAGKRERTPREQADVEHRANLRELTRQAHGVNLDLGAALLKELAAVAPDDIDVARFFALGVLGPPSTSYLSTSDHVARTIAANGCAWSSTSTARPRRRRSRAAAGHDEGRLRRARRRDDVAVALRRRREDRRGALRPRARRLRRAALRRPARAPHRQAARVGPAALTQGHTARSGRWGSGRSGL
jgi:hypothetical protein